MQKYVFLLLTLSLSSVLQAKPITLMLDWFVNPDHAAIIVAQQKGLFKQQGLSIKILEPADPSMPPKMVAAGKYDLAVSYQPQLIRDVVEGLPLTRIATLIATPLNTVMTLKKSKINSLADLKGKKIGYSFDGGLLKGSIATMLKPHGLTLKDVQLVNVGWSLSTSLIAGKVDAIYGAYRNFELNQINLEGAQGKAFYVEEEGIPPYDELVVIANSKNIQPAMIKKFNRALEFATQYIVNHPKKSWTLFKQYGDGKKLNTELNRRAWFDTISRLALRPSAVDAGRYQAYAKFLLEIKAIKRIPKSRDYLYSPN